MLKIANMHIHRTIVIDVKDNFDLNKKNNYVIIIKKIMNLINVLYQIIMESIVLNVFLIIIEEVRTISVQRQNFVPS